MFILCEKCESLFVGMISSASCELADYHTYKLYSQFDKRRCLTHRSLDTRYDYEIFEGSCHRSLANL